MHRSAGEWLKGDWNIMKMKSHCFSRGGSLPSSCQIASHRNKSRRTKDSCSRRFWRPVLSYDIGSNKNNRLRGGNRLNFLCFSKNPRDWLSTIGWRHRFTGTHDRQSKFSQVFGVVQNLPCEFIFSGLTSWQITSVCCELQRKTYFDKTRWNLG